MLREPRLESSDVDATTPHHELAEVGAQPCLDHVDGRLEVLLKVLVHDRPEVKLDDLIHPVVALERRAQAPPFTREHRRGDGEVDRAQAMHLIEHHEAPVVVELGREVLLHKRVQHGDGHLLPFPVRRLALDESYILALQSVELDDATNQVPFVIVVLPPLLLERVRVDHNEEREPVPFASSGECTDCLPGTTGETDDLVFFIPRQSSNGITLDLVTRRDVVPLSDDATARTPTI